MTTPGFTDIDLVAHSGDCAEGEFLHSLNVTDIHTTGVETRAVMGTGQARVQQALDTLRAARPFRLRGIDSDNGSEFINHHLYRYCQAQEMQCTRGRPYKKDDNAHIEQKHWTHVRKLVGYVRYDSPAALAALNQLYDDLRLFQNLWLPSVKLVKKTRGGESTASAVRCAPDAVGPRACVSRRRRGEGRGARRPLAPVGPVSTGRPDRSATHPALRLGQPPAESGGGAAYGRRGKREEHVSHRAHRPSSSSSNAEDAGINGAMMGPLGNIFKWLDRGAKAGGGGWWTVRSCGMRSRLNPVVLPAEANDSVLIAIAPPDRGSPA